MIKKLLFLILINLSFVTLTKSQFVNISNVTKTGKINQCSTCAQPFISCKYLGGAGSFIDAAGKLVITDPCDTTLVEITLDSLYWNQGADVNWVHGVFFPATAGFTFVSSTFNSTPLQWVQTLTGCTGTTGPTPNCPATSGPAVNNNFGIVGGPGFYYAGTQSGCCTNGGSTPSPCDNWGDGSFDTSHIPYQTQDKRLTFKFRARICNNFITGSLYTLKVRIEMDGNTGCWRQGDAAINNLTFSLNTIPFSNPLYSPTPSSTAPVKTCTPTVNYTSTLTGGCGNSSTITWWTAATGGTQVGSGSPFVYDPPGSICPAGMTLYAACCPATTLCGNRRAFSISGTCPAAIIIDSVKITNPSCTTPTASIDSTYIQGASGAVTYTLNPGAFTNTTGKFFGLTGTNYTLTATDASGCSASYNVVFTPSGTGGTAPIVTSPVNYCQGQTATQLTATGVNLLWYTTATGGVGNPVAPTPSTATANTTNYYVSQTVGGCESPRAVITVVVTATPAAPTVTSPVLYCQNATAVTLTATGANLLWYTTATGGTGSTTAPTPSTATVGSVNYYVSQTVNTCESPRATITVTVNAIPAAPGVTSPVNYCQNQTATSLTATGTNILWYTTATGGTGSTTAPTPSTTSAGTTNYYVTQTANNCESPRANITVNVTATPTAPVVTSSINYCQNDVAGPLTATGTNILWYTTATGGTGSTTAPTPNTAVIATTIYYVTQTNNSCESPRASITVNVTAPPAAPGVVSPVTYCQGQMASPLTATGTNLLWYTTATGGTGSTTAPTPNTATANTTTYYVSQTSGTCESPRSSITVNVNPSPAAPMVTSPVVYCQNDVATPLFASGSNILWYTTATGGTGSSTAPTPSTTTAGNTNYYVTQTTSNCESPRALITVTVNPRPAAPTVTSPVTYCQNDVATPLNATGTNLLWYTTATGGAGSSTAPTPSTSTVGSTIYYVSQTNASNCESPRAAITVNVTTPPAAPTVTSPISYCQGQTATVLTATGTALLWYTTATGGTGSSTAPTPSTTTVGNTVYYVSQTAGTCESPRASITVTINPTPAAPAVTTPVVYCQGETAVPLFATGSNLIWYTTATGGTGSTTAPTPSTVTAGNTNYYVTQSNATCESPRSLITVTVNSTPAAPTVTAVIDYCQFDVAPPLTAMGTNLLWYTASTGGTGSTVAPTPNTAIVATTIYYVSQTTGTCEGPRASITVNVTAPPAAPDVVSPISYCQGDMAVQLSATGTNLLWYTTATGGTGFTTAPTPSTTTAGTTTYYVSQTVGTCTSPRASISIIVNAKPGAPAVSSPVVYCQGAVASPLFAGGANLTWYTTATGGTGSNTAPTPSTATVGNTNYYVSQSTAFCESDRSVIMVTINPTPAAPTVTSPVNYCQGQTATALTAMGTNLLWYTTATGGTGSTTAPTPSTTTVGNTNYYVTQTTGTCEGPRALITVTVNSTPAAPTVTSPVSYCQNATAIPLTATGTNLLWYTTATGGTGSATAPTPSTSTAGNTDYYVSQTNGTCEGPRALITVTINATPAAPTGTTPVNYCQNDAATALTATGTNLLWYTTATGGTGSTTAPTPSTTTGGSTIYYVSQTSANNCEGPRLAITVNVTATPAAPTVNSPVNYCQGQTAIPLTATGTNLLWYTSASGGTGSTTAPTPSTTTVGNTNYYVSQTTGSCEGPRALLIISVSATPAAPTVTTPVLYCQNDVATALTATGTNLLWYTNATGGTGIATAPTPSTATVGNTDYYVSQTNGSCEGPRALITVTINSTPTAPTITSPINYCQGQTATPLTATGTNLLWYTTATGGTGSNTAPTPSTTNAGNTDYYVSQSTGNCEGPRALITVIVTATPAAPTVTTAVVYCQGATATALTATGSNLLWYTTATGSTGTAIAPTPSTSTVGNTNYYVSQTITNCEGPRALITVTINSTPAAPTVTTPVVYCQNATVTALTASGTNLLWYSTATGGTGSATAPTPNTTTAGNTDYYVSQTTGICEGPRALITVTVNATPALPTVVSPVNYCENDAATALQATGSNLLWYTTATGGTGNSTAPTPSTTTAGTTNYYVSQTINNCEGPREIIVVTVTARPTAPTVVSPVQYCMNETATSLTATGNNLLWYTTATGGIGSTTAPTPSTTTAGSTNYYVSQSNNNCEGPRATITIIVKPTPSNPSVTSPQAYCQNATATQLTATGTNLLWYTTATGGTGSVTAPTPSTSAGGITTYYVTQTILGCESNREPIVINVTATPTAPGVTSPVNYCPNDAATPLTANGTNLLWYTAATGGTGSTQAPTPSTASPGNTSYFVSQSLNGCEGPRAEIVVGINTILLVNIGADTTICQGETVAFTPTVTPAALSYTWRSLRVPTSTIDNINSLNIKVNPVDTATYILRANAGGCSSEDTVVVNVRWKPIVNAGKDVPICLTDSVFISGTVTHTSGPINAYAWTPTDSLTSPTSTGTFVHPTRTTRYVLTATTIKADYGCDFAVTDTVKVVVQPTIKAFAGNDTIAVKGVPHQLKATGANSYIWSSPTATINNPTRANPTITLFNDANVYVIAKDQIGCTGYDSIFIKVYDGPTYYVPNAFTPNGDGLNDVFRAIPVGMSNTTYFRIFNRYGEMMFETNQWLKGWDGTFKGKPQPTGVYIWMVKGTDKDFQKIEMKGTVNLIR